MRAAAVLVVLLLGGCTMVSIGDGETLEACHMVIGVGSIDLGCAETSR